MSGIDRSAPVCFLRTAYQPDDWIAVFLKSYDTGTTAQRVGPVSLVASARFQAWLRAMNASQHSNVYVSVNAVAPGQRSRRRDAIRAVRHLFLDVDADAAGVLHGIERRADLPAPSYILYSSADRAQVFWRTSSFNTGTAETLQKHLARELGADSAATACSQMARLPGFLNHKYVPPPLVTIDYRDRKGTYTPADFPNVASLNDKPHIARLAVASEDRAARAWRYLAVVPPAVSGQHGDLHTFRTCCRLVRGFALGEADALRVLADWNNRCQPPWSEPELRDKLRRARQYGREPLGGLLEARP